MFLTSLTAAFIAKNADKNENGQISFSETEKIIILTVFIFEIILFLVSVILAFRCGVRHKDTFVHIVCAFFFPHLYILYYFITGCGDFAGCN